MTDRLSTLDASFLAVERPTAHMHVGWKAYFAAPRDGGAPPSFEDLREHIGGRIGAAPRYRQRLAGVPLDVHNPVWIDDPDFDVARHVLPAPDVPVDELVDAVMSEPLRRDRPLWEMWVAHLDGGRMAMVGKAHHCMVDGIAAVELTSMLLDASPEGDERPPAGDAAPAGPPSSLGVLAGAVRDRVAEPVRLARKGAGLLLDGRRVAGAAVELERALRALTGALRPTPPHPLLNRPSSPYRHLAAVDRPLDDLRRAKRRHEVTINDVLLAAVAGALRAFLLERGEQPAPLKAMVPVNVRDDGAGGLGNRISFVFVGLPCDEPDRAARLDDVATQMRRHKDEGDSEGAKAAVDAAGVLPRFLQNAVAQVLASPHVSNLVVSNVPGPAVPLYLRGCRLESAYPIVPLADAHALSIGMMSVADRACFGLYADRRTLPDADRFADHLDAELDALLA